MTQVALGDIVSFRGVSRRVVVGSALAAAAVVLSGIVLGWPAWAVVAGALTTWVPGFTRHVAWTKAKYGWIALFYVLCVTQGGHMIEHVVQMVQIHVLHVPPRLAVGVFGALNIEWVHFIWNTWVIFALVLLIAKFPGNKWLWLTLVLAAWHEVEHVYIMNVYLSTGVPGAPGLLAQGGRIGGGLPITRPDLHFFYNLLETAPLFLAFWRQLAVATRQ